MRSLWNSFKIAFAMFSKIPMPQAEWTKENMKYMFCFFPVIGAVIAAAVFALDWISRAIGITEGFRTVILVLVPVFITGGIHVDGLLDTADALSSWQERERRLEILKDSHAGAVTALTVRLEGIMPRFALSVLFILFPDAFPDWGWYCCQRQRRAVQWRNFPERRRTVLSEIR